MPQQQRIKLGKDSTFRIHKGQEDEALKNMVAILRQQHEAEGGPVPSEDDLREEAEALHGQASLLELEEEQKQG